MVAWFVAKWYGVTLTANKVTSFTVEGPEDDSIVAFEVLWDVGRQKQHMLFFLPI
jgi:hypothetical protein